MSRSTYENPVSQTIHSLLFLTLTILLIGSTAAAASAQRRDYDRDRGYDRNSDDRSVQATSAGGNWTQSQSEDRMTAEKRTVFTLPATNTRQGDSRAEIRLYCTDGKLKLADFRPNVRLSRPNWGGFWGQPQMRVRVRADDSHDDHSWNWVNGHFLSMDKGSTRELIGAHLFRIEFSTPDGAQIAEFSPSGLDLRLVRDACGLTPKRP